MHLAHGVFDRFFFFFFSLSIRRRSFENNLVETLVIQRRRIGRFVG